jgi:hypothetical protein
MMVLVRGAATLLVLVLCAIFAASAHAGASDRYVADAEAKIGERSISTAAAARRQALLRARHKALENALAELSGPIDKDARKAVLGAIDAWTGAYRVLSESSRGDVTQVEVEVDIDTRRLAKRVSVRPAQSRAPMFVPGKVEIEGECGHAVDRHVIAELAAVGAVASADRRTGAAGGDVLDLRLQCRPLGLVRHTFVHAARVSLEATAREVRVAHVTAHGFARDDLGAVSAAVQRAVGDVGPKLGAHRRGELVIRVQSPLPAARVRRLERAISDSVLGVDRVELAGLAADGSVLLRVAGGLSSRALASQLEGLSLPGFSLTISDIDGPDTLTIRLSD